MSRAPITNSKDVPKKAGHLVFDGFKWTAKTAVGATGKVTGILKEVAEALSREGIRP